MGTWSGSWCSRASIMRDFGSIRDLLNRLRAHANAVLGDGVWNLPSPNPHPPSGPRERAECPVQEKAGLLGQTVRGLHESHVYPMAVARGRRDDGPARVVRVADFDPVGAGICPE